MYSHKNQLQQDISARPNGFRQPAKSSIMLSLGIMLLFGGSSLRVFTLLLPRLSAIPTTSVLLVGDTLVILEALRQLNWGEVRLKKLSSGFQLWFFLMLFWLGVISTIGFSNQNPTQYLITDASLVGIYLAGFLIGTNEANWLRLRTIYWRSTQFIVIPVVVIGLLNLGTLDRSTIISSPLYRAEVILIPSAFFGLIRGESQDRTSSNRGFIAILLIYGVLQALSYKRAPLMRTVAFVYTIWFLIPQINKKDSALDKRRKSLGCGISVAFTSVAIFTLIGFLSLGNTEERNHGETSNSLSGRFTSLIESITYALDFGDRDMPENYDDEIFRLTEIEIVYGAMTPIQKWVGTGLGGYVTAPEFSTHQITIGRPTDTDTVIIPNARSTVHIGMFWPFFKGGVVFWVLYYGAILVVLVKFPEIHRRNELDVACWFFLFTMVLFQLLEGHWMIITMETVALLAGACVGRLAGVRT